jgi:hypothetical protein
MNDLIRIAEPCSEKWSSMKEAGNGHKYCDLCKTKVHDFTRSSLAEINSKINEANGNKLCGRYHERHTRSSKLYSFINAIENKLGRLKLKQISIIIVTTTLFLSGCAHKKLSGAYSKFSKPKDKKIQKI